MRKLKATLAMAALLFATGSTQQFGEKAQAAAADNKLECGKACMKKQQFQRAIEDLQAYVKEQPKSCEGHLLLGTAYCKLHNFVKAKEQLRTAIRVGHGSPNAQKANMVLMTLPKQYLSPRTGPETRMLASMLGLARTRGGIARPTVIDFYAPWCQPCKQLNAAIDKVKTQYGEKITFMTVNVDDPNNDKLIDQYEVSPIPTLVFLNPEGEVVSFSVGYNGDSAVSDALKKMLADAT